MQYTSVYVITTAMDCSGHGSSVHGIKQVLLRYSTASNKTIGVRNATTNVIYHIYSDTHNT
jgi:hypothetical protein